ncbi:MAG: hypothetical protein WDO71_08500 [Bacteroidota bacterium]
MKRAMILVPGIYIVCCMSLSKHTGKPWRSAMQSVPGRVECEQYDEGGEGIAYHDADSINNGSGKLNPVNGNPLNEFRIKEGVDISYTKTHALIIILTTRWRLIQTSCMSAGRNPANGYVIPYR